ncbi:MAG: hypothetical protein KAU95_04600, partial [Candidatus Aenigmarchaeota archaeon]|nr:hypothetical protein [Candidatus Aenigmarchaeota archaeon]
MGVCIDDNSKCSSGQICTSCTCVAGLCSCIPWTAGSCGGGTCSDTEKQYTRTCTPSGCDDESKCECVSCPDHCSDGKGYSGGSCSGGTCNYANTQNCGANYCESGWSSHYCKNGNVYHSRTCHNRVCFGTSCYDDTYTEEEGVEDCDWGCSGGVCIECTCPPNYEDSGTCGTAGGCEKGQMLQTRTCSPSGCDAESRCRDDENCAECTDWVPQECGEEGYCGNCMRLHSRTCYPGSYTEFGCRNDNDCCVGTCDCSSSEAKGCGILCGNIEQCAENEQCHMRTCTPSGCDMETICQEEAVCTGGCNTEELGYVYCDGEVGIAIKEADCQIHYYHSGWCNERCEGDKLAVPDIECDLGTLYSYQNCVMVGFPCKCGCEGVDGAANCIGVRDDQCPHRCVNSYFYQNCYVCEGSEMCHCQDKMHCTLGCACEGVGCECASSGNCAGGCTVRNCDNPLCINCPFCNADCPDMCHKSNPDILCTEGYICPDEVDLGACCHPHYGEIDCSAMDGCVGNDYYDYYCSGGSCEYEVSLNDPRCIVPCECSSGICCSDGCNFDSISTVCEDPHYGDLACFGEGGCGDDVAVRYKKRYCSGSSSACDGAFSEWSSYEVKDDCAGNEVCGGGYLCTYDPDCEYFVECSFYTECTDGDECTNDVCHKPGTPESYCSNNLYCSGIDLNCGCASCENCNAKDGWYDTSSSSYPCCSGDNKCDCQEQEYRNYYCSEYNCTYSVTNTGTAKYNCADCNALDECKGYDYYDYYCSKGFCEFNVISNDPRCASCEDCDALDGCKGNDYYDYYCSGVSCVPNITEDDPRCIVPCECFSGLCCSDGCNFDDNSTVCDYSGDTEYGCHFGIGCGDDVGVRYKKRYCSGSSLNCNGALSNWGSWSVKDYCASTEVCVGSSCFYDINCTGHIECSVDLDCDEPDACTQDICDNPGTNKSFCSNTPYCSGTD